MNAHIFNLYSYTLYSLYILIYFLYYLNLIKDNLFINRSNPMYFKHCLLNPILYCIE